MSLISRKLAGVLGGISQQPPEVRPSHQCEVQENILSHRTLGARRRPPTVHRGQLTSSTTGYGSAFVHKVRSSNEESYSVVCVNNDLKVFDAVTGAEQTVVFPKGKAYLTSTKGFKAFTVGDQTFLVNMDTIVKRSSARAPAQTYEALVFVRQADFSTEYTVTVSGITVSTKTPDANSPTARASVATDVVAGNLFSELAGNDTLSAEFTFQLVGSTVWLKRLDGKDFSIGTSDGLADRALKVVKGSVQTFADLPARAVDGMVVQITGDPESTSDNYWVRYTDDAGADDMGVWVECPEPGTPLGLDPLTMPWSLKRKGAVLEGITNSLMPFPEISYQTSTLFSGGPDSDPDDPLVTFDGDTDAVLERDGQQLETTVSGADGSYRILRVAYDADTTFCFPGTSIIVDFSLNGSLVESREYQAGESHKGEFFDWRGNLPAASVVNIKLRYGQKDTPVSFYRRVKVTIHRGSHPEDPGVEITVVASATLNFGTADFYPAGTVISGVIDATPWSYTVSSDSSSTAVATGVASAMSASNPSAGVVVKTNPGGSPTWGITAHVAKSNLVFFNKDLSMTPNEHVGRTLKLLVDGSTGTISANGTKSITVSSLSGGITNTIITGVERIDLVGTSNDFVFTTATWDVRKAGSIETCPLPSFVDRALSEIFFYENRLGLCANEFTVLSQSGHSSNFMRQSATQLFSDDIIDVKSSRPNSGDIQHALEWNDSLYLFTSSGEQFALEYDQVLSPQTVRMPHKSSFPMNGQVRPVTLGRFLYFSRPKTQHSQVMQYYIGFNQKPDASDITAEIPEYITGAPKRIAGDAALEHLFILTDNAADTLWVHSYHFEEDGSQLGLPRKTMSSWSKWTFSGATIIEMDMEDGVLSLLMLRSTGVYLETIDLGKMPSATSDFRDRQTFGSPVAYTWKYRFSKIFFRDQNDVPITKGRLGLRYGRVLYHDTTAFTVTVSAPEYTDAVDSFSAASASKGVFEFPILLSNDDATIELSGTSGGFAFNGFEWEADYTSRS